MKSLKLLIKPSTISQKILLFILIVISTLTIIITFIQLEFDYKHELDLIHKNLTWIEKGYAQSISSSLWVMDEAQLQTQLEGIVRLPDIEYVAIFFNDKIVAQAGLLKSDRSLKKSIDLIYLNKVGQRRSLGKLVISASLDQVVNRIYQKILLIFVTELFKIMVVSFFIYIGIKRLITRHLLKISNYLRNLDFNSIKEKLSLDRKNIFNNSNKIEDELDILVKSFNLMRTKINQSYADLNQLKDNLEEKVKQNTQEILEQRQKLEYSQKMTTLGEMASGIAHEINNPMAIISIMNQQLRKSAIRGIVDTEKIQKTCNDIDRIILRISKIIHGMGVLSRDATNEEFSHCSVAEVIEDALDLSVEKFKANGISIRVSLDDKAFKTIIRCRRIQLSQVFLNLLINAFDAVEHLDEKWVQITCARKDNNILIYFIDSGPGIPPEIQDNIFKPFFTTKEVGKGIGLGLSLAYRIIQDHKGDLKVDNNLNNTAFLITLPIEDLKSKT